MIEAEHWRDLVRGAPALSVREIDLHLAQTLCELGHESRPEIAALIALLSCEVEDGHVCIELSRISERLRSTAASLTPAWLCLANLSPMEIRQALETSPLCGSVEDEVPLVYDDERLYLNRFARHERALAEHVRVRAREVRLPWIGMDEAIGRLFAPHNDESGASFDGTQSKGASEQRRAAEVAITGSLTVITGGPGTGKTSTVVKILALLVEEAQQQGGQLRVALLAPTGKAAARLAESIASAKVKLPCAPKITDAISDQTSTIHRALGTGARNNRIVRGRDNPLDADAVIVDEASMIDLSLMRHLFEAVPETARLILLGDRDQLSSIEAGNVLRDLCGAGLNAQRRDTNPLAQRVVTLKHSYRYHAESGIELLAQAIVQGDSQGAIAVLRNPQYADVNLRPAINVHKSSLPDALCDAYAPLLQADDPKVALAQLARFRVLCAHRTGPYGVQQVNEALEAIIAERNAEHDGRAIHLVRPIMVERNDHASHLYNGDVGILWRPAASQNSALQAIFERSSTELRAISPARLPQYSSVYAMTVHKSQGSEFDKVALVLPAEPSALVTRELLYTAVTRARQEVSLYADEAVIVHAIETAGDRASGLRARLWPE